MSLHCKLVSVQYQEYDLMSPHNTTSEFSKYSSSKPNCDKNKHLISVSTSKLYFRLPNAPKFF